MSNSADHRSPGKTSRTRPGMLLGVLFGAGVGVVLGVLLNNTVFIGIGAGVGMLIGLASAGGMDKRNKQEDE